MGMLPFEVICLMTVGKIASAHAVLLLLPTEFYSLSEKDAFLISDSFSDTSSCSCTG